jgi:hypothetical protein
MRNPAREEQNRRGPREVFRWKLLRAGVKILAHVVERHDDHHEAAQRVNGTYPRSGLFARHGFLSLGRSRQRVIQGFV